MLTASDAEEVVSVPGIQTGIEHWLTPATYSYTELIQKISRYVFIFSRSDGLSVCNHNQPVPPEIIYFTLERFRASQASGRSYMPLQIL